MQYLCTYLHILLTHPQYRPRQYFIAFIIAIPGVLEKLLSIWHIPTTVAFSARAPVRTNTHTFMKSAESNKHVTRMLRTVVDSYSH